MCVTRGTEYEYPIAKERLFAFLFYFVRDVALPIGRAGGTDRESISIVDFLPNMLTHTTLNNYLQL